MNILYLSPVGFFKGGAEKSLFDLLSNPNVDPVVLAPEDGPVLDRARESNLPTHVLDFGSINKIRRPFSFMKGISAVSDLLKAAKILKQRAKEHQADIVHSNGLKAHMINCVSRWLFGAHAVLHIRDIPYTKAEKLVWYIMYFMCSKMVLVSAACWPGKKLPRKCVVIHNGTPLVEHTEKKYLSDNKTITLGFAGRLHPGKGVHLLLDWLAAAKKQGADVFLSIRGSFSEDAPEYERSLNAQIKDLNLQENVEFLGHIDDPEAVFKGLDIVVVPSEKPDPLPRSVMESMARGIPVFGYPAGGIFEMIEDGITGFMVKDENSFCAALQKLQNDPEMLLKMTKAAQDKIEREFTIAGLHREISAVYKDIA